MRGSSSRTGHDSGSHSRDRLKALPQWTNAATTSTTSAPQGSLPSIAVASRSSSSWLSRAGPSMRSVSITPGTMTSSAAYAFSARFWAPSKSRLPGSSPRAIRVGDSTRMKPGGPPRGLASQRPSAPDVATTAKGESARIRSQLASSSRIAL